MVPTLQLPTSFEQLEIAKFLEGLLPFIGDEMVAWTVREHATNARLTADFLSRPCFTCAPAVTS